MRANQVNRMSGFLIKERPPVFYFNVWALQRSIVPEKKTDGKIKNKIIWKSLSVEGIDLRTFIYLGIS